ncbi:tRNA lysidine(34) synthetase TilS [Thermosyntropha sp.]|uniref:tRNA lysidine(34) synthetase TilS n=1 Tax=Thermosyntropha sp. TaxID=2740820 RepID=UPI0025EEAA7B|nr:tRNA lysidine(34) synthetase TilS [Thermosyntropha sp.]MBO8159757.1 tRNA lysidine(34) synthetase TilS [Thermosyntropha sp.]
MLEKVSKFIIEEKLILPEEKVVLGLSGGPDSMALLHVLKGLEERLNFSLFAAHLNHGIRKEADDEARFVEDYCREMGVPVYIRRVDIKKIAQTSRKTLEEAGREERYRFFREIKEQIGTGRIATAHHQDDLAETVLHHMIRGTGIRGLRGIMPVNGDVIRPFLCVSKSEILDYLEENKIPYCIDVSNYEKTYTRNRIRNELIPYLENNFNPRIRESLGQLADIARIENDFLERETENNWDKVLKCWEDNRIVLDISFLNNLHLALKRRIIMKALREIRSGSEENINIKDVQSVIGLLSKAGSSKVIHLSGDVKVNKSYEELIFMVGNQPVISYCYEAFIPGEVYIPELKQAYKLEVVSLEEASKISAEAKLDYGKIRFPIFIRSRQKGDVFRPAGLKGSKKIKDFFIDEKIPVNERDKIPLIASYDEIYAILGIRVSEICAITSGTEKVLVIKKNDNEENS